jgi:hypothetical protein
MAREEQTFQKRAKRIRLLPSNDYETQVAAPGFVSGISFRVSGRYSTTAAGLAALDTTFNYLGSMAVVRGDDELIAMRGVDIRHGTAFFADYAALEPNLNIVDTTALTTYTWAQILASGKFELEAPWAGRNPFPVLIDARKNDLIIKGKTRGLDFIGDTVDDAEIYLDVYVDVVPPEFVAENGGHFFEPRISQSVHPLQVARDEVHRAAFKGGRLLTHAMFRQLDKSLEQGVNANLGRSDTLVRALKLTHQKNGEDEKVIMPRTSWPDLKQRGTLEQGLASLRQGVALYSFDDPRTRAFDALKLASGDEIHVEVDTESDTDPLYLTGSPTAAAAQPDVIDVGNDQLICTWFGYTSPTTPLRLER